MTYMLGQHIEFRKFRKFGKDAYEILGLSNDEGQWQTIVMFKEEMEELYAKLGHILQDSDKENENFK